METAEEFIKRKEDGYTKNTDKEIRFKDISRKGRHYFIRESWVFMKQSNLPEKVFVFERLKRNRTEGHITHTKNRELGDIEYRFGYYIVGKIGNREGKWTWGQYCPIVSVLNNRTF